MQTLSREGFGEAYNMDGGIKAWKGLVAEGVPEAGLVYFSPAHSREDFILLSWNLEEGTRTFYDRLAGIIENPVSVDILRKLVDAEEGHKATLKELHERSSKDTFDPDVVPRGEKDKIMEGGIIVASAVEWAGGKALGEILELSMSLEANAYDRYVLMSRAVEDEGSKEVFTVLSREEKVHLDKLTALFENIIAK